MHDLGTVISQLTNLWRAEGIAVRSPCGTRAIAIAEERLGRPLPEELKRFYSVVDGMAPEGSGPISSRHIRIWPLEEVHVATAPYAGDFAGGLLFADYLLGSHDYCLVAPDKVALVSGGKNWLVANTLLEFLGGYVADDPVVFGGPSQSR